MSETSSKIRFELLGGFRRILPGQEPEALTPLKANQILAYLVAYPTRKHLRDELCTRFWEDAENARQNLRQTLHRVRKEITPPNTPQEEILFSDDYTVSLASEKLETDVAVFERSYQLGLLETDRRRSIKTLEQAFDLYQGEFLAGFQADWIDEERRRLEVMFENLCLHLMEGMEEIREFESAVAVGKRLLNTNPFHEQGHCNVIRLYAKMGQPHLAKAHYANYSKTWQKEFNTTPAFTAQEAEQMILDHLPEPILQRSTATEEPTTALREEAHSANDQPAGTVPKRRVEKPLLLMAMCLLLLVLYFMPRGLPEGGGKTLWVRSNHPMTGDGDARPVDVKTDAKGNIYMAGFVKTATQDVNYLVIKYAPDGTQIWETRYNNEIDNDMDRISGIALDNAGNVYVTGESISKTGARPKKGSIPEGGWSDIVTIKYAGDSGAEIWEKRYNPHGDDDKPIAIGTDREGNVYVLGTSLAATSPQGTDLDDFVLLKYSPEGNLKWEQRYNSPYGDVDRARALFVDAEGNCYVAGSSKTKNTKEDYVVIKYDTLGVIKWLKMFDGSAHGEDIPTAITVSPAGNVYVTGYSMSNDAGREYMTLKYDANGNEKWQRKYNGAGTHGREDRPSSIALDAQENVYVTGRSDGDETEDDYATIKYNPDGNQVWVNRYNGPGSKGDEARKVVIGKEGRVYVTGEQFGGFGNLGGTNGDIATLCYDSAGKQQWLQIYDSGKGLHDSGHAMAVDNMGNVIVAGQCDSGHGMIITVIKYAP